MCTRLVAFRVGQYCVYQIGGIWSRTILCVPDWWHSEEDNTVCTRLVAFRIGQYCVYQICGIQNRTISDSVLVLCVPDLWHSQ